MLGISDFGMLSLKQDACINPSKVSTKGGRNISAGGGAGCHIMSSGHHTAIASRNSLPLWLSAESQANRIQQAAIIRLMASKIKKGRRKHGSGKEGSVGLPEGMGVGEERYGQYNCVHIKNCQE